MIGKSLLHYRILEKIGEGGMGVVYKALDTHLDRPVAVKILPPDKVADPERKRRFILEAKAASALRHPNIVVVHDIASTQGQDFIVMEYVEGQSLDHLTRRKGMKVPQALALALQIADGLAKAHAAGIVHRDIKPTNIMVTADGLIKILDFGLAKLAEDGESLEGGRTMTFGEGERPRTEEGFVVGTAAYMSPEQAEGKKVDARSDIFSFGVVLYEMLTGRRAFQRDSKIKTLAAVLGEEPAAVSAVNADIPVDVERLVARCLRKDPQRRWQTMSDLKVALQDMKEESESGTLRAPAAAPKKRKNLLSYLVGGAALLVAAAFLLKSFLPGPRKAEGFEISRLTYDAGITMMPAISPDGRLIAYASDRAGRGDLDIWVQQISGGQALRLTDHPAHDWLPAFSPDGSRIAFRSERDGGGIYMIDALGGEARRFVDGGTQPSFSPDGSLLAFVTYPASLDPRLSRIHLIPAKGGPSRPFQPEFCALFVNQGAAPVWSPDGKNLIFCGRRVDDPASTDFWVAPIDGGKPVRTGAVKNLSLTLFTRFPTGWDDHGVYFTVGTTIEGLNIFRVPIEAGTWSIAGPAVPITSGLGMKAFAGVARNGLIAFANITAGLDAWSVPANPDDGVMSSNPARITQDLMTKVSPSISRDGRTIAFTAFGGIQAGRIEIRRKDLQTGQETVFPMQGMSLSQNPRLSPDGSLLAYRDFVGGSSFTFLISKGAAAGTELCKACTVLAVFSDNASALVQADSKGLEKMDIRSGVKTAVLAADSGTINDASLSPDDAWIACLVGRPDGRAAIEIARCGGGGDRILIAEDARYLNSPRWSPNGRYLYFVSEQNDHCAVFAQRLDPITKKPLGKAREVFTSRNKGFEMNFPKGLSMIGVAADKIIVQGDACTGNIFLATPRGR
jgi:Tol biopolymer transport system component/predicted Ser/Thr protein kinase